MVLAGHFHDPYDFGEYTGMIEIIQGRVVNILILLAEDADDLLLMLLHVLDDIDALFPSDEYRRDNGGEQYQVTGAKDRVDSSLVLSEQARDIPVKVSNHLELCI